MLLQLRADEGDIYLVDALEIVSLTCLKPVLESVPLLVHGGQADLQILHRMTGAIPKEVFDTQITAGFCGQGYPARLLDLVQKNLGQSIDKTWTLSDWSKRPLSPEQLRYAADDVRVLPPLAHILREKLAQNGHTSPCAMATANMVASVLSPEDPEQLWRLIPGSVSLDPSSLGALQALAKWRDQTAKERDLPRNYLLTDALLLDTARRKPNSMATLLANRRFPAQIARKDGQDILDLLANSTPLYEPAPSRLRTELIRVAARVAEQSSGIATELVLAEGVLHQLAIVMERVSKGEIPVEFAINSVLELWRQEALGKFFRDFLESKSQISMASC